MRALSIGPLHPPPPPPRPPRPRPPVESCARAGAATSSAKKTSRFMENLTSVSFLNREVIHGARPARGVILSDALGMTLLRGGPRFRRREPRRHVDVYRQLDVRHRSRDVDHALPHARECVAHVLWRATGVEPLAARDPEARRRRVARR